MKVEQMQDRQRIQQLLALSQPVTQEITFFRDCRPRRMAVDHAPHNPNDQAANFSTEVQHEWWSQDGQRQLASSASASSGSVRPVGGGAYAAALAWAAAAVALAWALA